MKYLKSLILTLVAMFVVNGCNASNSNYNPYNDIFPSNSSLAEANDFNANELIDRLIGYNTNMIIPRSKIVDISKKPTVVKMVIKEIEAFKSINSTKAYRVTDISDDYCLRGELLKEDLGIDGIKYTYKNCLQNGYYYSGIIIRKKNGNRLEIKYDENFKIETESSDNYLIVKRDSKIVLEKQDFNRYKIELNIVYNSDGKKGGFKDIVFNYDNDQNSMYQTKGRVYLNDLENYADFDDRYNMKYTPLIYDEDSNIISGEFYYRFRGASLHITINDGVVTYSWSRD